MDAELNRDTQKFASKCSSIIVNGQERDVFKRPVTDSGKTSKAGRLKSVNRGRSLTTMPFDDPGEDLLQPVFRNGEVLRTTSLAQMRERAAVML